MAIYLAAFDLRDIRRNYQPLFEALAQMGAVPALDAAWLINVRASTRHVTKVLLSRISSRDRLFLLEVAPASHWSATRLKGDAAQWLKRRRP